MYVLNLNVGMTLNHVEASIISGFKYISLWQVYCFLFGGGSMYFAFI